MKVTYEHKPAMTFIGYSTSIRPEEGDLTAAFGRAYLDYRHRVFRYLGRRKG